MKLSSVIAVNPVFLFTFLAIAVLLLPSLLIAWCNNLAKEVKQNADMIVERLHYGLVSEIENSAKMLQFTNSSVANLANMISPLMLNGNVSGIKTKVAPILFQAFSTIPMVSQISFIDLEGPSLTYYFEGNGTYAMYTSSASSRYSATSRVAWNKQAVDPKTGKPLGRPIRCKPFSGANTSWINETLSSTYGWHASVASGGNTSHDPLFLNSVRVNAQAVVSLGFSVREVASVFSGISLFDGSLYLATLEGQVLLGGIPNTSVFVRKEYTSLGLVQTTGVDQVHVGDVSCLPNTALLSGSVFSIGKRQYDFYCSPIQIFGVQSVYAMAMPREEIPSRIQKGSRIAFALSMVMMAILFICILSFVLLLVRAERREMHLRSLLARQMEYTQQAERKSMNKSNAFSRAIHDIRNALAAITARVELATEEMVPIRDPETKSKLKTYLIGIKECTERLGGILNSVLDRSKTEADKMEEEEFDVAKLLEDAVDTYYPVGVRKGIDVVLDLCDNSVVKYRLVKGDKGKLMKILWNLLSNAVKFTVEGHVSVRAKAQKPSLEDNMIASSNTQIRSSKKSKRLCWRNKEEKGEEVTVDVGNRVMQSPNCMEFVFEVQDTGIGIPRDKRESVFEDYVQVKEKALQVEGTGLGLGIVQSLVRLMGGEIKIVDKPNDERGTCFRFNVFLLAQDNNPTADDKRGDFESREESLFDSTRGYLGLNIRTPSSGLASCTPSPRLTKLGSSPKVESSHVVLFISNKERCRVSQKYIEANGIKVSVVERSEHLHPTLMKIKRKFHVLPPSSSGKSDLDSCNGSCSTKSKEFPLSSMEGVDQMLPHSSATSRRGSTGFVLLVIDAKAECFREIDKVVAGFKRGLSGFCYKVVWLDRPTSHRDDIDNGRDMYDINLIGVPFHGTLLQKVLKLLPEFGGASFIDVVDREQKQSSVQSREGSNVPASSSGSLPLIKTRPCSGARSKTCRHAHKREIQSENSSSDDSNRLVRPSEHILRDKPPFSEAERGTKKLLSGQTALLAEDMEVLRKFGNCIISKLGATVHECEDGEEAVDLVRKGFQQQEGPHCMPPYDFILMDCQMAGMDGYEATRQIRKEEEPYGVHIPIIALSANTSEEFDKMWEAGMDAFIVKPLSDKKLIDAIKTIQRKRIETLSSENVH